MKQAYDNNGVLTEVSATTPTNNKGGVRYLLTPEEESNKAAEVLTYEGKSSKRIAMKEIQRLEGEVTERRIREAILGIDNGWLATQDALIVIERAKL